MRRCSPLLLAVAFIVGCGSSSGTTGRLDLGGPDADQVATLVEDMNEAKGDAKKTSKLFAAGAKPDARVAKYEYSIIDRPAVNGSSATCKVRADKAGGEKAGETDWTFVKEGDKWKIKSAPLP